MSSENQLTINNLLSIVTTSKDMTESWNYLHSVYTNWLNKKAVPTTSQINTCVDIGFRQIKTPRKRTSEKEAYDRMGMACVAVQQGVFSNPEAVTPPVVRKATYYLSLPLSSVKKTFHERAHETMGFILNAALANVAPENQKLDESQKISLLESMQGVGQNTDISTMPKVFDGLIDLALSESSTEPVRLGALGTLRTAIYKPQSEQPPHLTKEQAARLSEADPQTMPSSIANSIEDIISIFRINERSKLFNKLSKINRDPVYPGTNPVSFGVGQLNL